MDLVLNDYSIEAQFNSLDDFLDQVYENTIPLLKKLKSSDNTLYKTYRAYDLPLFDGVTINTLIRTPKYGAYPEVTALKQYMQALITDPYWEDCPATKSGAKYQCAYVGEFSGDKPNCFSETLERNGVLVSFPHHKYLDANINIKKDETELCIRNCYSKANLADHLLKMKRIGLAEFLMSKSYSREIEFYGINGKYYVDELYNKGQIDEEDIYSIERDFRKSIEFIENGNVSSRFTDSIKYKNHTYYEFRCSIPHNREFRIYYILHGKRIIYLNSYIKKTQTLGNDVKDRTISIIEAYLKKR